MCLLPVGILNAFLQGKESIVSQKRCFLSSCALISCPLWFMTSKVGFIERTLLGECGYCLAMHVCMQCCVGHPAGPLHRPGFCIIGLMREQPLEESRIAPWAVVAWRQACVLGGAAGWCWVKSHLGVGAPHHLRVPVVSCALLLQVRQRCGDFSGVTWCQC